MLFDLARGILALLLDDSSYDPVGVGAFPAEVHLLALIADSFAGDPQIENFQNCFHKPWLSALLSDELYFNERIVKLHVI